MWVPTTHPGNGNTGIGTLNGVGEQGQERSRWKILQQAQAGGPAFTRGDHHRRSWSPHSPVIRRALSMVPAL